MDELRWYWDKGLRRCDDCEKEVEQARNGSSNFVCTGCWKTAHGQDEG